MVLTNTRESHLSLPSSSSPQHFGCSFVAPFYNTSKPDEERECLWQQINRREEKQTHMKIMKKRLVHWTSDSFSSFPSLLSIHLWMSSESVNNTHWRFHTKMKMNGKRKKGNFLLHRKEKACRQRLPSFSLSWFSFSTGTVMLCESHTIPVSLSYRAKHDTQGDDEGVPSREVHIEKEHILQTLTTLGNRSFSSLHSTFQNPSSSSQKTLDFPSSFLNKSASKSSYSAAFSLSKNDCCQVPPPSGVIVIRIT